MLSDKTWDLLNDIKLGISRKASFETAVKEIIRSALQGQLSPQGCIGNIRTRVMRTSVYYFLREFEELGELKNGLDIYSNATIIVFLLQGKWTDLNTAIQNQVKIQLERSAVITKGLEAVLKPAKQKEARKRRKQSGGTTAPSAKKSTK